MLFTLTGIDSGELFVIVTPDYVCWILLCVTSETLSINLLLQLYEI